MKVPVVFVGVQLFISPQRVQLLAAAAAVLALPLPLGDEQSLGEQRLLHKQHIRRAATKRDGQTRTSLTDGLRQGRMALPCGQHRRVTEESRAAWRKGSWQGRCGGAGEQRAQVLAGELGNVPVSSFKASQ
jgi:hypothetical protein